MTWVQFWLLGSFIYLAPHVPPLIGAVFGVIFLILGIHALIRELRQ